ncbi:MAG: Putative membrane protein [Candidatus Tokpelaia hoelldobleri]|uniref:Membrane protein n=1 Tax=Candidatus Tokpelaia hoelldobleri TaxID=1902579 RepID=A0A1U9JWN1_9HYPH|nr:MAG: Putative membrane protein [Candidatus Tokpelaia hoelldoblerii]
MRWYLQAFRKYVVFKGRAERREFWYFLLFQIFAVMLISFLERQFAIANPEIYMGRVTVFYLLITFVPALAVTVRRLHDSGFSGWWVLLGFIPAIGVIIILVLAALPGAASRRYG